MRNSAAGGVAEEILSRIRTVMAFNGQREGMKRYLATPEKETLVIYLLLFELFSLNGQGKAPVSIKTSIEQAPKNVINCLVCFAA